MKFIGIGILVESEEGLHIVMIDDRVEAYMVLRVKLGASEVSFEEAEKFTRGNKGEIKKFICRNIEGGSNGEIL